MPSRCRRTSISVRSCNAPPFNFERRDLSRSLTWGLRCQEQNLQASSGFFRALTRSDEREAWHILAALRSLRQTLPCVPPVADGPDVSLISPAATESPMAFHMQICGGRNRQDQPREDETITNFCTRPWHNSHPEWSPGGIRTTNITLHERSTLSVARSSLPHPYTVYQIVDPNHDAVIRIGSEAPKQRYPFCIPVWKPLAFASNRYLGASLANRCSGGGRAKLMIFYFSCLTIALLISSLT